MKFTRFSLVGGLAVLAALVVAGASTASADMAVQEDAVRALGMSGTGFKLKTKAAQLSVGKPGSLKVTVKAASGYKVNDKYPHKIKFTDVPDGLKLPDSLKKKDGTFESKDTFSFKVPVTASKAGEYTVKAKIKFSVCSDKSCIIEKQVISLSVSAS